MNGFIELYKKNVTFIFFRKKIYKSLEELQIDVDQWLHYYNHQRPHSGKYCYGKTPMQTFLDARHIAQNKNLGYSENMLNDENTTRIN